MKKHFIGSVEEIKKWLDGLGEGLYQVIVDEFLPTKARTQKQNAFYWTLLEQFAEWGGQSKIVLHNLMLMNYGQREKDEDGNYIDPAFENEIAWERSTEMHLYPLGKDESGKYVYRLLRSSRTYNSTEYSLLITGLVNEIEGSGASEVIETLTMQERLLIDKCREDSVRAKQKGKYYCEQLG